MDWSDRKDHWRRRYKGVEIVYISGGDCDRFTHVCPAIDGAVVIVSNTSVASIAWRWCNTCVNHLIYKCHSRLKLLSARNWTITVYITEWMSVSPSSVVIVSLWRILETIDDTRTPEWVLYSSIGGAIFSTSSPLPLWEFSNENILIFTKLTWFSCSKNINEYVKHEGKICSLLFLVSCCCHFDRLHVDRILFLINYSFLLLKNQPTKRKQSVESVFMSSNCERVSFAPPQSPT